MNNIDAINNHNEAKKTLAGSLLRFIDAEQALKVSNNPQTRKEWSAAYDAHQAAKVNLQMTCDLAYPQPDIEVTSSHVIVRRLGLSNLLKADQIVKERHAAGDLKFTRVFRGEAALIAEQEGFLI